MKKVLIVFSIFLSVTLFDCGKNDKKVDSDQKDTTQSGMKNDSIVKNDVCHFEPDTSIIVGLLQKPTFFGPPDYGRNPAKDSKEELYILNLLKPVDIEGFSKAENKNVTFQKGLPQIQIFSKNKKVNKFLDEHIGDKVMVKGKLMGATTPHHHTIVIMEVIDYISNNS